MSGLDFRRHQRLGMATLVLTLVLVVVGVGETVAKKADPSNKPDWAKKDLSDFNDADLERLYDQWEEDDEPLEEDELPEYKRQPKMGNNIPLDKVGKMNPDDLMKLTKKGKTVMMFVSVAGAPSRQETEDLTSLWQGALRNNHIQAERYVIEDARAIFLFHDGAQAWEAKAYLLEQERLKELTLEGQGYQGKHFDKHGGGDKPLPQDKPKKKKEL